jgi:XTP/dITP diphosphohydrolase
VIDVILATRSAHKAAEIRDILAHLPIRLRTLRDIGLDESTEEDLIENADTFVGNARAKARFFFERTQLPVIADDSGLEVFALDGQPGVRTRRFAIDAGYSGPPGLELDHANNRLLLERLRDVPDERRGARYVCAAAFCGIRQFAAIGTCQGSITHELIGTGGFGYDPLFWISDLRLTFAQISQAEKNRRSHRAHAFRALSAVI